MAPPEGPSWHVQILGGRSRALGGTGGTGGTSRASSDGRGEVPASVTQLAINLGAVKLSQDSKIEQGLLALQHALRTSGTCHPKSNATQGRATQPARMIAY